jgi:hypothetical protein
VDETAPPSRQLFEKLVNKNAIKVIKPKIGDHPGNFLLQALTPILRVFGNNMSYPTPCIFNPCASMNLANTYPNYILHLHPNGFLSQIAVAYFTNKK